jgi:polyhydroxyalkanoate synthase subunit PhaC
MADRMMPDTSGSRFALSLAKQPRTVASRAAALCGELVSVAAMGPLEPAPGIYVLEN